MARTTGNVNVDWEVNRTQSDGLTYEAAQLEVLMDIREELRKLNRVVGCHNFLDIPRKLERIARHTVPRKKP